MAMCFNENGVREIDITLTKDAIRKSKNELHEALSLIPEYPGNYFGKGIVISGGGLKYFTCAWVLVSMLKAQGCNLPIEVWSSGNELSLDMIDGIEKLGVKCKNLKTHLGYSPQSFLIKPLSIIHSSFEEVLFLDSDNICTKDPSYLFNDINYLSNGCIFWPDYWRTSFRNPIWEILELQFVEEQEQESGQLLINKKQCWKALNLAAYMNQPGKIFASLIYGDKDTFRFAWKVAAKAYYMIEHEVGTCGYIEKEDSSFNGVTMVQFDANNEILFLHRNLLKWDVTKPQEKVWDLIKKYSDTAKCKRYSIQQSQNFHGSVDLFGDCEIINFREIFPTLEESCLEELALLRNSDLYTEALQYGHLQRYRFSIPHS